MATRPSELMLSPEETGLPRRASPFSPKQFGGLGEPKASLGEPGSRKLPEMTILPLPLGIFCIHDQSVE